MREQITLYGDDAEQFQMFKQDIAEKRGGNEPSNAEMLRLFMQEADREKLREDIFR